jgi:hypothetical protein
MDNQMSMLAWNEDWESRMAKVLDAMQTVINEQNMLIERLLERTGMDEEM